MKTNKWKGIMMLILATTFWGISGPLMEWLFRTTNLEPLTYMPIRLLLAGILILTSLVIKGEDIWRIWQYPKEFIFLIIFGLIGMLGAQYAFIKTVDISNAVTATLFQFLGPVIIAIYVAYQKRSWPSSKEVSSICLALLGIYLLITNGSMKSVVLSTPAILMGILTGIGFAYYTLSPRNLIKKWGTSIIIGWAMLIGGLGISLFNPTWMRKEQWNFNGTTGYIVLILIILLSTIAFLLYIGSLHYVSATDAGILSSIEPFVVFVLAITWLKQSFGFYQIIGGICVIFAVVFLTTSSQEEQVQQEYQAS